MYLNIGLCGLVQIVSMYKVREFAYKFNFIYSAVIKQQLKYLKCKTKMYFLLCLRIQIMY